MLPDLANVYRTANERGPRSEDDDIGTSLARERFSALGFRMGLVPSSNVVSAGIQELRRSGVVRMAAEPVTATAVVAAGDALLADLLPDGGFPVGFISELRGNASSGRLTLAARVLLRALAAGERAAFVTSVGFFPGLAPWLASALDGALFCRVTRLEDGLAAVEVLATTGSVDLLVIDAVGLRASDTAVLPDSTMARIERAARSERVAIVALTDEVSARAVALGSRPAIRIELVAPDSFIPNGARQPTVSLVRSRFNRASSSGSAPKQSRPLGAR